MSSFFSRILHQQKILYPFPNRTCRNAPPNTRPALPCYLLFLHIPMNTKEGYCNALCSASMFISPTIMVSRDKIDTGQHSRWPHSSLAPSDFHWPRASVNFVLWDITMKLGRSPGSHRIWAPPEKCPRGTKNEFPGILLMAVWVCFTVTPLDAYMAMYCLNTIDFPSCKGHWHALRERPSEKFAISCLLPYTVCIDVHLSKGLVQGSNNLAWFYDWQKTDISQSIIWNNLQIVFLSPRSACNTFRHVIGVWEQKEEICGFESNQRLFSFSEGMSTLSILKSNLFYRFA